MPGCFVNWPLHQLTKNCFLRRERTEIYDEIIEVWIGKMVSFKVKVRLSSLSCD
jgi:hypothetical protein